MDSAGFVVSGYAITVLCIAGYVARLRQRAHRARKKVAAIAQRRQSERV